VVQPRRLDLGVMAGESGVIFEDRRPLFPLFDESPDMRRLVRLTMVQQEPPLPVQIVAGKLDDFCR